MKSMRPLTGLALALLLALPVQADAQGRPERGARRAMFGLGPQVQAALEHRSELGLSQEQADALTALQAELEEVMAPLMAEIRSARESGDQEGMRSTMGRLRAAQAPLLERFREILTDQQREKLRAFVPRRGGGGA